MRGDGSLNELLWAIHQLQCGLNKSGSQVISFFFLCKKVSRFSELAAAAFTWFTLRKRDWKIWRERNKTLCSLSTAGAKVFSPLKERKTFARRNRKRKKTGKKLFTAQVQHKTLAPNGKPLNRKWDFLLFKWTTWNKKLSIEREKIKRLFVCLFSQLFAGGVVVFFKCNALLNRAKHLKCSNCD